MTLNNLNINNACDSKLNTQIRSVSKDFLIGNVSLGLQEPKGALHLHIGVQPRSLDVVRNVCMFAIKGT